MYFSIVLLLNTLSIVTSQPGTPFRPLSLDDAWFVSDARDTHLGCEESLVMWLRANTDIYSYRLRDPTMDFESMSTLWEKFRFLQAKENSHSYDVIQVGPTSFVYRCIFSSWKLSGPEPYEHLMNAPLFGLVCPQIPGRIPSQTYYGDIWRGIGVCTRTSPLPRYAALVAATGEGSPRRHAGSSSAPDQAGTSQASGSRVSAYLSDAAKAA